MMKPKRDPCPGCGSEAASARCARCRAAVCAGCNRRASCPLCAFEVVQEVLAGRRVPAEPGDAKLTHHFLEPPASDIRIDVRGIEQRRRDAPRPARYFRDAGPVAVGHLMDRAGLTRITEPTVAAIRSAPIWIVTAEALRDQEGWGWSTVAPPAGWPSEKRTPPDHCGWFIPGPDALQILLRAQLELPPAPRPIPTEGPFAAVPLPPWSAAEQARYRDEDPPRRCPHCQQSATRFRVVGDVLICAACGRSFAV